jgi:4-hydroxybenzoate polyprenyltransferase
LLPPLLELTRPRQWPKNLVVFAALLFSGNFLSPSSVARACQAFLSFLLLSSSVYALNDLVDVREDRSHPSKRERPIASGKVSGPAAAVFLAVLALAGFGLGLGLGPWFAASALAYLVSTAAYTLWLKHVVILDVFFLALGFVLRAVAGGLAIAAPVSEWLLLCTSLLALFLGLAKRRHEIVLLKGGAGAHRRALSEYNPALLDEMMAVVTSSTVVAYALYTFQAHRWHDLPLLMLTIPFVLYGIFRYLYLVHQKGLGGSPENVLLRDRPIILDILAWIAACAAILYWERRA